MIGPHREFLSDVTPFAKVDWGSRISVSVGQRKRSRTSTHDIEVGLDGECVERGDVDATFGHAMQDAMEGVCVRGQYIMRRGFLSCVV